MITAQPGQNPRRQKFTDNDSKFHFGRLPGERYYYVGIPDTLHHYDRNPLVLATSTDGKAFNKQYIIADELYQLKTKGLWKGGPVWLSAYYAIQKLDVRYYLQAKRIHRSYPLQINQLDEY